MNEKGRIQEIRLLLQGNRNATSQHLADITKTCNLIEQYRNVAQQSATLFSAEEMKVQNLRRDEIESMKPKLLEESKSLWIEITNACQRFSLAMPTDFGDFAFPALEMRFHSLLNSATQCELFDRLCDETLNRSSQLDINSLTVARQQIVESWEMILKQNLKEKTRHQGPEVMQQLGRIGIEHLGKSYLEAAHQAWNALQKAKKQIEMSNAPGLSLTVRLTMIAQAQLAAKPDGMDVLKQPEEIWQKIQKSCQETQQSLPTFEVKLMIDGLRTLQSDVSAALDHNKSELARLTPSGMTQNNQKIEEYAKVIQESEVVAQERIEQGVKICRDVENLNQGLQTGIKEKIQAKVEARARAAYLYKNDPHRHRDGATLMNSLIPNLAVQQEVHRVNPATIEEIEQTKELIAKTSFTLDANNANAAFHVFAAIAKSHDLGFALMPSPTPEILADSWNKAADFALEK
jgi:hypothetical protein